MLSRLIRRGTATLLLAGAALLAAPAAGAVAAEPSTLVVVHDPGWGTAPVDIRITPALKNDPGWG